MIKNVRDRIKLWYQKKRVERLFRDFDLEDFEDNMRFHDLGFRIRTVIEGEYENGNKYRTHIYESGGNVVKVTRIYYGDLTGLDDYDEWELDFKLEVAK
jgi:hypothetical protein